MLHRAEKSWYWKKKSCSGVHGIYTFDIQRKKNEKSKSEFWFLSTLWPSVQWDKHTPRVAVIVYNVTTATTTTTTIQLQNCSIDYIIFFKHFVISNFIFLDTLVKVNVSLFTVWCNQVGTVYAEMSSWTASTRHLGMKTIFQTKYIKANMFEFLLWCF